MGCNMKFKNEFDKLMHHNDIEPSCLEERNELLRLVQYYKIVIQDLEKNNNLQNNLYLVELKNKYNEIISKLLESDLAKSYLGNAFDDQCINLVNNTSKA